MNELTDDSVWERLGPWALKLLAIVAALAVAAPVALVLVAPLLV